MPAALRSSRSAPRRSAPLVRSSGAEPIVPKAFPFLKWVGGKTSLLPTLLPQVPPRLRRYHEPFVGGGALFFALSPKRAILSDVNEELVHCYQQVRDAPYAVIDRLSRHVYERTHFEQVRALDPQSLSASDRAARFIFLNKTCFNGLWRVNRAGRFNVPFGRYTQPRYCDPSLLLQASAALEGVQVIHQGFQKALARTAPGDFVYLDPPYDPVSATSSFTAYSKDAFGWAQQEELHAACVELDRRGVHFMLSNSATPRIRALYKGFNQRRVRAPRHINCKAGARGMVEEIVVSNEVEG